MVIGMELVDYSCMRGSVVRDTVSFETISVLSPLSHLFGIVSHVL